MNTNGVVIYRAMAFSFAVILLLSFWPIVLEWRYFRPDWLVLWLVFWTLYYPQYIGVGIAFGVGLFWDLITGSLLGSYALSCAIVVYMSRRLGRNIMMFSGVEKAVLVFFLLVIAIILRVGGWLLLGEVTLEQSLNYIITIGVTLLAWPLMLDTLVRWQNSYLR
ncbi:MAG: rod shape-determining protein MreD [Agitococcus sp.]